MSGTMDLPETIRVFERGWLSANNILLQGRGGAALIDSGYVTHAPQTIALVKHALAGESLADEVAAAIAFVSPPPALMSATPKARRTDALRALISRRFAVGDALDQISIADDYGHIGPCILDTPIH